MEDLTKAIAAGDPGSPHSAHAEAVLQAKGVIAATATAEDTRKLVKVTWYLMATTVAAVLVALGVAVFK